MRVLSLIYSHRVQGFSKAQLDLTPTQKRNPNPKRRSNSSVRKLQLDSSPFQDRSPNLSWILQASSSFHLLSPYNLHHGEDFSNLNRTPIYHLAKLTHDLGLSAPNETDTRSRLGQQMKYVPSNESLVYVQLIFTDLTRSKLSLSLPPATFTKLQISIVSFQLQLSYLMECINMRSHHFT